MTTEIGASATVPPVLLKVNIALKVSVVRLKTNPEKLPVTTLPDDWADTLPCPEQREDCGKQRAGEIALHVDMAPLEGWRSVT